jgi:hypothetical protein
VVGELIPHFHVNILKPSGYLLIVHFETPFEDRTSSLELFDILFPKGIFDPSAEIVTLVLDNILEFCALAKFVVFHFLIIHYFLFGHHDQLIPMDLSVKHDLLGSDLHFRRIHVLDMGSTHKDLVTVYVSLGWLVHRKINKS